MTKELLTVKEASEYLQTHPKTVYKLAKDKEIPVIRRKRIGLRFRKSAIDKWLDEVSFIPIQNIEIQPEKELDISLAGYDKRFLKEVSGLNKKMTRWRYSNGIVYRIKNPGGSESWGIEHRDENGKRKQRIVPNTQSREDAVIALNHKVQEVFNLLHGVKSGIKEIKFNEFADLYLKDYAMVVKESWKSDYYYLKANLIPYFGCRLLSEIRQYLIEKYKAKRIDDGVQRSTVNRELACLKKMYNKAIDWEYAKENPVIKVKFFSEKDNMIERVLTVVEEEKLIELCEPHLKPIIITALQTGMRKGEILSLKWQDVNFSKKEITVEKTKSGRTRIIPISKQLLAEFEKLKKAKSKTGYVFTYPKTGKPTKDVKRAFQTACRRAGIKGLRFHDLRHTFASRLVENGEDIITVRDLLGHSSVRITERYTHSNKELKRKAVESLSKKKAEKVGNLLEICEKVEAKNLLIDSFSVN